MPRDSGKTFEEKVLKVIAEATNDRGGGTVMRVMSWIVDGKVGKPQIDKRDWWQDENGQRRIGKAKGITAFDLLTILRNLTEVAQALQIPAQDIELALNVERKQPVTEATAGGPF